MIAPPTMHGRDSFSPADIVAIKVNPSGAPQTTTSIALVREVIQRAQCGRRAEQAHHRLRPELESARGERLSRRCCRPAFASSDSISAGSVKGETRERATTRSVYCEMDCFGERETRSYLASIVSSEADKIINLPCLKEHNASGVTGCLKNLAYGSFNNVARTHDDPKTYTDPVIAGDVQRRPAPVEGGAQHHGRHPRGVPQRAVRLEPGVRLGGADAAVRHRSGGRRPDRAGDRGAEAAGGRRAVAVGPQSGESRDQRRHAANAQKNPFYREPGHIRTASELGLGTWELDQIDRRVVKIA